MATPIFSSRVRFGVFEVDLRAGELRKQGIKIKLHDQPFKVLAILLEHPGEVVTREQICQRLWPADTFVDSEVGLNSAVKKLRDALGDSAENPRFLETLPRRGYRLIVPVVPVENLGAVPDPHRKENTASSAAQQRILEGELAPRNVTVVAGQQEIVPEATARPGRPISGISIRGKVTIALGVLAVLAVGAWWRFLPMPDHQYSIAVLPLRNLSPEPGSDYFSDGLTDEIISNLSMLEGLEVKSRTSSFTFKDRPRDIHAVGAQLGAKLILEGSVLRSGDKLRVNVQLFRVADDAPVWSGRYDRELKDVFEVQDEISRSIVNELRLNLGRGQRRYNTNLEAYDFYLRAKSMLNHSPGYDHEEIAQSIPLFQAAIAKDPSFAPAYAGIADAYAYLSATPRTFNLETAYVEMRVACPKALQLDPLLAEAHACMGLIDSRDHNWGEAERAFRRAIELNPNLSRPREDFAAWVLTPLGRLDESERELRTAIELDPLSPRAVNFLDYLLVIAGRYDEVLSNSRRVLATDPENYGARQLSGRAWVQKGNLQEGIATLEKLEGRDNFLAYAYAKAGRRAEAEQIAAKHKDWPWLQALVYAGLGDKDKALAGLRKMAANKDPRAGIYPLYPEFAFLRGDPRLNEMRQELGLPEVR
jgi:TolB-like protein/DNA-binding winged helix-turn-helix (wHTH) protein/Tfp pilus assembly protein PilF